jgi:hypothetical protein
VYLPDKDCVVWSIKQFNGSREYLMRAHFGLPSIAAEEPEHWRAPIEVQFEIPYFTVSGIQVRKSWSVALSPAPTVFFVDCMWAGPQLEGDREEQLPGFLLGEAYHAEWSLSGVHVGEFSCFPHSWGSSCVHAPNRFHLKL